MQPIISYIYEYEGDHRIRNAGFAKMLIQRDSRILNIHVKSFYIRPGSSWTLYAFQSDGEVCTLHALANIAGAQHSLDAGITLAPEQFPEGFSMEHMEGIWLMGNEPQVFAAAWKPTYVNAGKHKMWGAEEKYGRGDEADSYEDNTDDKSEEMLVAKAEGQPKKIAEMDEDNKIEIVAETMKNEVSSAMLSSDSSISSKPRFRKIQRQDLTLLPRKSWYLANNSFLLHGYYNYHHLLFVEKDNAQYLGVPGIYDHREARAAELFGFPRFSADYAPLLNLADEECNSNFQFGHYLRKIRI